MKKTFKVPVIWESYGVIEVEASTPQEAISEAIENAPPSDRLGLC